MSDQFPVRVQMRSVGEGQCVECSPGDGTTFYDSFTVITSYTPLSQLVDAVLQATGYQHLAEDAKGLIQLKHWKPLSFDQLTDDPDTTVDSLAFRDMSNHITLIIITKGDGNLNVGQSSVLRDRFLKAILNTHPEVIQSINNQPLKEFVNSLIHGISDFAISSDQVTAFNNWLDDLVICKSSTSDDNPSTTMQTLSSRFHQTLEVPKLQSWFEQNPNPSRSKLQQYMQALNSSPIRQHNHKILYQQICQWFTNARAVFRRQSSGDNTEIVEERNSDSPSITVTLGDDSVSPPSKIFRPSEPATDLMAMNAFLCNRILHEAQQRILSQQTNAHDTLQVNTDQYTNSNKPSTDSSSFHSPALCTSGTEGGSNDPSPSSSSSNKHVKSEEDNYDSETPPSETALSSLTPDPTQLVMNGNPSQSLSPMDFLRARGISQVAGGFQNMQMQAAAVAAAAMARAQSQQQQQQNPVSKRSPCGSIANAGMGRSRLMFDPLTELPLLEQWFEENPHPSWIQIDQFTDSLNTMSYRKTYPPVTTHNVKIWFKNRRAKCKRMMGASINRSDCNEDKIKIKDDLVLNDAL